MYTGEDIRRLREEHEWTQTDLASMLGVSPMTVSRWERGSNPPGKGHMGRLIELFTNGSGPVDRVSALEGEVSQLRDEHSALVALVVRLARDGELLREEVRQLIAAATQPASEAGEAQQSEPQAGR